MVINEQAENYCRRHRDRQCGGEEGVFRLSVENLTPEPNSKVHTIEQQEENIIHSESQGEKILALIADVLIDNGYNIRKK